MRELSAEGADRLEERIGGADGGGGYLIQDRDI
jgi:hypothetical protein